MAKLKIASDTVSLFRFFVLLRLLWTFFMLANMHIQSNVFFPRTATIFSAIECGVVLGYLYIPWLKEKLGRIYLPLGLLVVIFLPWIENQVMFEEIRRGFDVAAQTFSNNTNGFNSSGFNTSGFLAFLYLSLQIQLLIVLFVPVILLSWQYPFRWMIVLNVVLVGLDIGYFVVSQRSLTGFFQALVGTDVLRTFLFLLTGFVVSRLAFEAGERNRQLSHYAATLDQLTTSRERNRIAREIHDTLAHTLSGLAVNLEAVTALFDNNPDKARVILNQSLSVTRTGLEETRRAIQALRAGPLEDLGLVLALKQMALSSAERYGLQANLDFPEQVSELDPAVEQCIYRIAEEGLRNLCQHAEARQFEMKLACNRNQVEFMLTDDGRGFENWPVITEGHFGMRGMLERAEAAGGKLIITSQPHKGTSLKLVF